MGSACCGCISSVGLVLGFLDDRPVIRTAPALWKWLVLLDFEDDAERATHLSAEDAIKFAISEYRHVDCRLMHARQ